MILDISVILIILISTLLGFIRGLTREVFSFLSIFLGIIGASRGYQNLVPFFQEKLANEILAGIVSFIALFFLIVFLVSLIGTILCKIWRIFHLSIFDRIFGCLFGLLRGLVIVGLIAIIIEIFPYKGMEKLTSSSFLFQYIKPLGNLVLFLFPFSFQK